MKSFFDFFRGQSREPSPAGDTATVRKIVRELEQMDPDRARFVAAFAYLLSRVANADLDISSEETQEMEDIVRRFGELPEEQAILIVEIAKSQNRLLGGTEDFQVAQEFKRLSSREQREDLLHCLFAVSAADDEISGDEEARIRQIADELGFSHREYIEVRTHYNDKRTVIQRVRAGG
ncbi:MAG: TerB family tellurite resistance protein [bacterium]|nr:TerB family tellurite resistance protein [bacterium]